MIYRDWATGTGPGRGPFLQLRRAVCGGALDQSLRHPGAVVLAISCPGRLPGCSGPGIADKPVAIDTPALAAGCRTGFTTRSSIWTWDKSYADGKAPEHIRLLRAAIRF